MHLQYRSFDSNTVRSVQQNSEWVHELSFNKCVQAQHWRGLSCTRPAITEVEGLGAGSGEGAGGKWRRCTSRADIYSINWLNVAIVATCLKLRKPGTRVVCLVILVINVLCCNQRCFVRQWDRNWIQMHDLRHLWKLILKKKKRKNNGWPMDNIESNECRSPKRTGLVAETSPNGNSTV